MPEKSVVPEEDVASTLTSWEEDETEASSGGASNKPGSREESAAPSTSNKTTSSSEAPASEKSVGSVVQVRVRCPDCERLYDTPRDQLPPATCITDGCEGTPYEMEQLEDGTWQDIALSTES
jgi:hypothetical protein